MVNWSLAGALPGCDGSLTVTSKRRKVKILGLGLDNDDGHVRVTRSENFYLLGGSEETHKGMQEKCIKFDEELRTRGKELASLERHEFLDLAAQCDMNVLDAIGDRRGDDK